MQWGNFFGTVTHGLSINTVSLDCDFHWKDATHKIDFGLSYGVQNGVLRRNNRILQKVQFSIVSPNQSTTEFIVLQRFVHNWPRVVSPPSQPICKSKGNGKTISIATWALTFSVLEAGWGCSFWALIGFLWYFHFSDWFLPIERIAVPAVLIGNK